MANWLTRGIVRLARKYDSIDLFRDIYGGRETDSGISVTRTEAMRVSAALACGRVIAEGLAQMPLKLMQETRASGGAGVTRLPAVDHPLYDLLAFAPNPLQTAFEFKETIGLHLAFCGNAFVWAVRSASRRDVIELWAFEPGWVTVNYQFSGAATYTVRIPNREAITLQADSVWHIRGPSWVSYLGLDTVVLAREALGLALALEQGQARLQSKGIKTPGVLSVQGSLTEEQEKKLRKWLEDNYEGSKNAGRTMIVDRAAQWISTSMSNVDAQTRELRSQQVEEVCRFFRVMPIMIGFSDKAQTYASAEQMFLAHLVHTLGPWAMRVETSGDRFLLGMEGWRSGYYFKFNEKAMYRMATKDQGEYLARMALSGIITRNEAREKLEMNPLAGLDEVLTPVNTFVGADPPDPAATGPADPADPSPP